MNAVRKWVRWLTPGSCCWGAHSRVEEKRRSYTALQGRGQQVPGEKVRGTRRGEGTGTMSWKDQGRFRAWSDPEAQVEYGYAETEPKESRQKEKCARGRSSAHLLFTFQCITMNTSAEHRGCKVNNSLLLGCSRSPAVRSNKVRER